MRTKIIGTGSYLPEKLITNDDLSKFLDTSDEWIATRTGIRERRVCDPKKGETCVTMGVEAAKKALEMAQISPQELDYILVATCTADYRLPTASCMIQDALGCKNIPALDISAACAGSIYGLNIADSFIRSGNYKKILFICSEALSSVVNWQDRNTAVLFGDGASAAILSNSSHESGFIDIELYADGSQQKTISVPAGGSARPIDSAAIEEKADKIQMNGRETFKFAVRAVTKSIDKILAKHELSPDNIKFIVPHQANLRIIEAIGKRLGLANNRFLINLDKCANTSAASLLLAYDQALRAGKLKPNDLMLMLAIGAGFAWGTGIYKI